MPEDWRSVDRGEIQFLVDESGAGASGDDVLELGGQRRVRPAVVIAVLTAALVAAVGVAVVKGHSGAPARPVSAANLLPSAVPSSAPVSVIPPLDLAPPIEGTLLDVALGPTSRYVLTDQQLVVEDVGSGAELASTSVSLPSIPPGVPTYQLRVDAAAEHLWIIPTDGTSSSIYELDAVDLQEVGAVTVADTIQASAVLDGVLYLATSAGVRAVNAVAHTAPLVTGLPGDAVGIAADPTRGVLVVASAGFPARVVVFRPATGATGTRVSSGSLVVAVGAIAVAHGQLWVQGYGAAGPSLVHLDEGTLRPAGSVGIGEGATLVATGTRVLWVRSGAGGTRLSCVDAVTGEVSQSFSAPGGVVVSQDLPAPPQSRAGVAFLATSRGVAPLALTGCAG